RLDCLATISAALGIACAAAASSYTLSGRSVYPVLRELSPELAPIEWTLGLSSHLLLLSSFEFIWTQIVEGGMPRATVVKDFYVVEDFAAGLGARAPSGLVDQFNLECGEEALGHCVVPAIGSAAHAAQQRMPREQLLVFAAGVLAATIRMVKQSALR